MADHQPTDGTSGHGGRLRAAGEGLAGGFPALLVEAEHLAQSVIAGEHGRRQSGAGETFWQFRNFREGDGRASVDWRRSARSQSLYVRETEWELAQSVWLWCDRAPSMDYVSDLASLTKSHAARVLTLAAAILLIRAGERIGDLEADLRARSGETALHHLTQGLVNDAATDAPLPAVDHRLSRANVILVSDFLRPADEIVSFIAGAAAQGANGHVVQILDPAEEAWPFEGRILFEGAGAGESLLSGSAGALRKTYQKKLRSHRARIEDAARQAGWSFTLHHTDAPAQTALLSLYARLSGEAELMREGTR